MWTHLRDSHRRRDSLLLSLLGLAVLILTAMLSVHRSFGEIRGSVTTSSSSSAL